MEAGEARDAMVSTWRRFCEKKSVVLSARRLRDIGCNGDTVAYDILVGRLVAGGTYDDYAELCVEVCGTYNRLSHRYENPVVPYKCAGMESLLHPAFKGERTLPFSKKLAEIEAEVEKDESLFEVKGLANDVLTGRGKTAVLWRATGDCFLVVGGTR